MTKKPKMGRPKLPARELRKIILQVRLSTEERALIAKAAQGSDLSTWVRETLLRVAGRR